jgi:hypothetical protein
MTNTKGLEGLGQQIEQLIQAHIAASLRSAQDAVARAFASAGRAPVSSTMPRGPRSSLGQRRVGGELAALGERFYEAVCAKPGETMSVLKADVGASARELHRNPSTKTVLNAGASRAARPTASTESGGQERRRAGRRSEGGAVADVEVGVVAQGSRPPLDFLCSLESRVRILRREFRQIGVGSPSGKRSHQLAKLGRVRVDSHPVHSAPSSVAKREDEVAVELDARVPDHRSLE